MIFKKKQADKGKVNFERLNLFEAPPETPATASAVPPKKETTDILAESINQKLTKKELKAFQKSQSQVALIKNKETKKRLEKEKRLAAKERAKEKAARQQKDQSEIYIIRKNTTMKILRFIFWAMLIFLFIKGVIVSVRPDPTVEVNKTIDAFKADFSGYKDQDNEILSFAQNFAKEYLTYTNRGESEYAERIKPYVSASVLNAGYKFVGGAKALYTQAYKKSSYSANQVDVYVLASVEYATKETSADKATIIDVVNTEQIILKVPLQIKNNRYIVEDIPVFVNDDIKINDYIPVELAATDVSKAETDAIKQALTIFFKAYYEEEQSVINYYLTNDADKASFKGLNKRVLFNRIDTIRCCKVEGINDIIALITLSVIDKNGVAVSQRFNVKLVYKDNQYYVRTMDTKIVNLNIKTEVNENEQN